MLFNVNIDGIKNGFVAHCEGSTAEVSEWMGRAIACLKSGVENVMPYLQDKRIATIALIAVNLLLIEIVNLSSWCWNTHCPTDTEGKRIFRDLVDITCGLSILVAGVTAFAKYTKLPFSSFAIVGISLATLLIRSSLSTIEN